MRPFKPERRSFPRPVPTPSGCLQMSSAIPTGSSQSENVCHDRQSELPEAVKQVHSELRVILKTGRVTYCIALLINKSRYENHLAMYITVCTGARSFFVCVHRFRRFSFNRY